MRKIIDGLSNNYMFGEKYMDLEQYTSGLDVGDVYPMLSSLTFGTTRFGDVLFPPLQDTPGKAEPRAFGSAHSGSYNAAFCDGSVRSISYDIDPTTHGYLANRHDGEPVDASAL